MIAGSVSAFISPTVASATSQAEFPQEVPSIRPFDGSPFALIRPGSVLARRSYWNMLCSMASSFAKRQVLVNKGGDHGAKPADFGI
jgi:hypothetical protein